MALLHHFPGPKLFKEDFPGKNRNVVNLPGIGAIADENQFFHGVFIGKAL